MSLNPGTIPREDTPLSSDEKFLARVLSRLTGYTTKKATAPEYGNCRDINIMHSTDIGALPSALKHAEDILPFSHKYRIAVFLDYDGTLTPIVSGPRDAILSDAMRASLQTLADLCPVAIISGRDSADVRQRVAINALYYAGNHGLEITGPDGKNTTHEKAVTFLSHLDRAEYEVRAALNGIQGCEVERKRFAVAIHYRNVNARQTDEVKIRVKKIDAAYSMLRLSGGKKILELLPNIPWNKGSVLNWLIHTMILDEHHTFPLYLGDDCSDEDAFFAVKNRGVGILVAARSRNTAAGFRLNDTNEVRMFIERVIARLRRLARPHPTS